MCPARNVTYVSGRSLAFHGIHTSRLQKSEKYNPRVRYELSPMSRTAHQALRGFSDSANLPVWALCWQCDCATRGPLMDWLNWWIVGAVGLVTLYVAVRLVLRHYCPPDS
jgi:hypothetical protein